MTYDIILADNGYIVEYDNGDFLSVYQSQDVTNEMCRDLLGELIDEINSGTSSRYKVKIDVQRVSGYKFKPKQKSKET